MRNPVLLCLAVKGCSCGAKHFFLAGRPAHVPALVLQLPKQPSDLQTVLQYKGAQMEHVPAAGSLMQKRDCGGDQQGPDGVQASSTLRGSLEVWFWRAAGDNGWTLRKAPTAPRKPSWRRNMADISPCIAAKPG